jgi:molybdopterin converting factor small subunit
MVHVTVRLGGQIWRQAGKKEITVALALGATEADLVDVLVDLYLEREEEVVEDEGVRRREMEIGIEALIRKYGAKSVEDPVARITNP